MLATMRVLVKSIRKIYPFFSLWEFCSHRCGSSTLAKLKVLQWSKTVYS